MAYSYGAPVPLRQRDEDDPRTAPLIAHGRMNVDTGGGFTDERGAHSILSTSVEDERLNEGRPTLIPSVYGGRQLEGNELIEAAMATGQAWPAFETNELATEASKRASNAMNQYTPSYTFGQNIPLGQSRDLEPGEQPSGGIQGMIVNPPTEEELAVLARWRDPEGHVDVDVRRVEMARVRNSMRQRLRDMVDESYADFEEDPWVETLRKTAENAPDRLVMQYAGAMRGGRAVSPHEMEANARHDGVGDITESERNQQIAELFVQRGLIEPAEGEHPVQTLYNFLGSPEGEAYRERSARLTPGTVRATEWWNEAAGEMHENLPQVQPYSTKWFAASIMEAMINMGPAVAATIATRNPNIGAMIMGGQVYGETYGSMLDRGATPEQAAQAALFFAAAEILTERIPLHVLTRNNYTGLKKIFAAAGAEMIQEPITEALQMGYEYGILDNEDAFHDAFMKLIAAGVIGFGAGGGMGTVATMTDQLRTPGGQDATSSERELERIAADMEERVQVRDETMDLEEQLIPLQTAIEDPTQLSDEQTQQLADDGLVMVRLDERVQVLPKLRREHNRRTDELEKLHGQEALVKEGATREDAPAIYETIAARQQVDEAGAETNLTPTPLQQEWGNYQKGRFTWNNQEIAIETPAGEVRRGPDFQQRMNSSYGYFVGKPGADDVEGRPTEGVDAYVGPDVNFPVAYVINQKDPAGGFDEHKVMVGYRSQAEAEEAYRADFAPGRDDVRIDTTTVRPQQLKLWLDQDEHTKPLRHQPVFAVEEEGEGYPMAPRGEWYGEADYEARGGRLERMTPDDFLAQAAPLTIDTTARENIDDLKAHMRAGKTLDPLTLRPGIRARDSDGRHRAIAARELGFASVPVVNFRPEPEAPPAMHVADDTVPTVERYRMRGKNVVGSPPKVKSLDDVDQQIEDFVTVFEDSELIPAEAWLWYEQSGAAIRDITQQDPQLMHSVVKVLAALSQASGVAANTTAMIKAAYEIAKGNTSPMVGRFPNQMSKNINSMIEAEEITTDISGIGDKVVSFYQNLYDATFNTNKWPGAVTIDRWIARIMNYRGDAVSGTQYDYARNVFEDAVNRYNARHGTDWTPKNGQSALWVHERSRSSIEKTGKPTDMMAFSDPIGAATANLTHEAIPSMSTPMGEAIAGLPYQERSAYTQAMMGVIYEGQKNLLLEEIGIPLYTGKPGSGGYEGVIAPNQLTGVLLLKEGGQHDRATADVAAQSLMYIYQQDSVLWFRPDHRADTKKKKFSQGVTFRLSDEMSPEAEAQFFDALAAELGPNAGYTRTGPDEITVLDVKNEAGVAQSQLQPAEFVAKMEAIAEAVGEDIGLNKMITFGAEASTLVHDWVGDPNGEALRQKIQGYARDRGRPDLSKRVGDWRKSAEATTRDWTSRRPRERVAASIPVDRLSRGPDLQREVYGRYGDVNDDVDTTESLKYYDLEPIVTQPELVNKLVEDLGFQVETFSFEEGNVRIPKLGTQNYDEGYLWIYDPAAEHGSFKDTEYTRAWRVSHEAGHGITESFMQKRYGDSRRYGRLGRPMTGQRGAEGKRVDVELEPLTLAQAQRAVEWEDVTFRAQRMLLREVGIRVDEVTFAREFNTNIADAVYRSATGDFGDPGEYGFTPSSVMPDVKSVLESLEATEQLLAEQQGREPTTGADLDTWEPVSDAEIRQAVKQKLGREPVVGEIMFSVGAEIPRNKNLSPTERAIEQRYIDMIDAEGVDAMWTRFQALDDAKGGFVLNTDTARELSEDYLADRTLSNPVHEPASYLVKAFYAQRLTEATPTGRRRTIVFTAGGTGAGKSTGAAVIEEQGEDLAELTYDTNLTGVEKSAEKIQDALDAGRTVEIQYVWRDPVEAFQNGVLTRAARQAREFGTGRTLGLNTHMDTYIYGYETIRGLIDQFGETRAEGDSRVVFSVIDNSRGKGNAVQLSSISDLETTNLDYNSLEGQLYGVLEEARQDNRINEATYQGILAATRGTKNRSQTDVGRAVRESPEPGRAPGYSDSVETLRTIASEFVARFPNSPDITIAPTVDSLPEGIRARVKNNAPKSITGMFVPAREGAKIYLVAENITGPRHALDTLLHESVGHYGLRSVLGAEYDTTMDKIFKSHNAAVRRAARRNSIPLTNQDNRRLAAEEFVAYRAQQALMSGKLPKGSWFTDLIDSIKIAIARMRGIEFSDTEVTRLIMKARKFTSTPAGLAHGAARNMRPPVLGYRAWQAINDRRVPSSGPSVTYVDELRFQRRAGNLDAAMTNEMIEWVAEQPGRIDKYELLKKLQQIGNAQAMFHVETDGRRDAILNGDNMDTAFDIEEGSKKSRFWNALVFKAQDKFIDLLNVEKAIEQQTGAPLPDDIDAYLQEELYHGRIKHGTDEYHEKVIKPLVAEIRDSGYQWDEVEWYLYARHAPEANAQLYKINRATAQAERARRAAIKDAEETYADRPRQRKAAIAAANAEYVQHVKERLKKDPGLKALSGLTNEDAEDTLAILAEKGDISQLHEIAALVDAMTAETRRVLVEEGLETQETIDAWEATYDHYVPLKGFRDGPGNTTFFPKKGKGYDTGGAMTKRRMGRRTLAANILANIVAQHQSALVMSEKAKVGRSLLELAREHPNPKLWTVNELPVTKAIDKTTGLVVTRRDPLHRLRDNVIRVKVEGQDYIITFNENYEPGLRIARSMKNLNAQEMNWVFNSLLRINRVLSAVNTSFNPEFILSNLARDLQTAAINLNATDAQNVKTKIMKDVFKAHRGIRRYMGLPSFKDQEAADFWRAEFEEYRSLGAQVGWLDNYKDVQDLERSLYREMNERDAGLISWQTLGKAGRYIEMENQAIENAVRLSAFHHAKQYMTPERAASLSKNLTVNFNRKGDVGTQMNALFLFYNASIQGMSIMWHSAKSPRARKVMYGLIAFAAAANIINRMIAGDDDDGENRYDKIEFYVKERNMILMLPERWQPEDPENQDDYYITIPLPYGYNMLYMLGNQIGAGIDYFGIGNKRELDPMEGAWEIMATVMGSFNPIGTGPTPLQTMLPTVFQPLAQVSENTAWHGGPVFPEPNAFDPAPPPESQWAYRSVPTHAKALAEFLNRLGGGTDVRPAKVSFLDMSPETIQMWEEFLTGGAGRFVTNLVELGVMAKEGEIEVRNVPFVRRLVGKTDERQVQNRYYDHREGILRAEADRDAAREARRGLTGELREQANQRLDDIEETYAVYLRMRSVLRSTDNFLTEQRTQRRAVEEAGERRGWTEERTQERVDTIEERMTDRMNRLNARYQDLLREHLKERAEGIFPLLQSGNRDEIVQNFRDEGMPAVAALIESLPRQAAPAAQPSLQEAGQ